MTILPDEVLLLERELRGVFAARLHALVAYGLGAPGPATARPAPSRDAAAPQTQTLAIVESLEQHDLAACAERIDTWHAAGLATPLLLTSAEFRRSLDAFPLEFGAIIADHTLVAGRDPFEGAAVDSADIRRACEVQARSHLLHLREGYLETEGKADRLATLIVRSAAPFAALLASIARLQGLPAADQAVARIAQDELHLPQGVVTDLVALARVTDISPEEAARMFPAYLDATERLVHYVDGWSSQ